MIKTSLLRAQKQILKVVTDKYPQVYLMGGTALSLSYNHRMSEDLDFFTQKYTRKLHREISSYIRQEMGYSFTLVEEERRRGYVNMAVYEFDLTKKAVLKIDFVSDFVDLIKPRQQNGMASIEDIYYRKILAVIGWKAKESHTGRMLAGGRQKTKDLFDIHYLSTYIESLNEWFPRYFNREAYERLVGWYLGIPKQKTVMELLELVPRYDTKAVFKHLDNEIIYKLNVKYLGL